MSVLCQVENSTRSDRLSTRATRSAQVTLNDENTEIFVHRTYIRNVSFQSKLSTMPFPADAVSFDKPVKIYLSSTKQHTDKVPDKL